MIEIFDWYMILIPLALVGGITIFRQIDNWIGWIVGLIEYYRRYSESAPKIERTETNFFTIIEFERKYTSAESLDQLIERLEWIRDNMKGRVYFDSLHRETEIIIYFTDAEDAMAYKLRWS